MIDSVVMGEMRMRENSCGWGVEEGVEEGRTKEGRERSYLSLIYSVFLTKRLMGRDMALWECNEGVCISGVDRIF